MHLENQIRSGFDQLGGSGLGDERSHARRERSEQAFAEIGLFSLLRSGSRIADINDDVVNHRKIAGAR